MNLFSDDVRRNPYPLYDQLRAASPVLHEPRSGLWMVFDYSSVHRVLSDSDAFSSRHGPADWLVFQDPPRHASMRGLISRAFTPRSIANLEPRIEEQARRLLDRAIQRGGGEIELAADLAIPLPMLIIGDMLGICADDRPRFTRWNDVILNMSYTVSDAASAAAGQARSDFVAITAEMSQYLEDLLERRRSHPADDLLTRLLQAEIDGERLSPRDILGFFQLLLLAGSETTTNLINNAILCLIEFPGELERLRARPDLLPSAVEEALRFRSPLQWMFRRAMREVELHGRSIPAGGIVLAMLGSANRDPAVFTEAARFDIAREPNPHIAFGHGIHFCLGAALARLEGRIALREFLARFSSFEPASGEPWEPRPGLHVHGPTRLALRCRP